MSTWAILLNYWVLLAVVAGVLYGLERLRPLRRQQKVFRWSLWTDVLHIVFFYYAGLFIYKLAGTHLEPRLWGMIEGLGYGSLRAHVQVLRGFSVVEQFVIVVVAKDFLEYWIHRLNHAVPWLWVFHKVHHSVTTEEMNALVSSRFHLMETIVYRTLLYGPLFVLAADYRAIYAVHFMSMFLGFFAHANADLGRGLWGKVFNHPRFHVWHHAYALDEGRTVNFGVRFTVWDQLFGTAHMRSDELPARLGYEGQEELYPNFFGHQLFPMLRKTSVSGRK